MKWLLYLLLFIFPTWANAVEFKTLRLQGIEVSVPADWYIVPQSTLDEVKRNASEALRDTIASKTFLGVHSSENNHQGQIRLSTDTLSFSAQELRSLTPDELAEVKDFMREYFAEMQQKMGMKFFGLDVLVVDNPNVALLTHYTRNGKQHSKWRVRQYRMPDTQNNRDVLLTLSYDLAKEAEFQPIMEKVLSSVKF